MTYTAGYGEPIRAALARRRASGHAEFFLPHLRPGLRVLDCGCGPGSITLDLAAAVTPGEVVGVDIGEAMVAAARAAAAEGRVDNARFARADVGALPFAGERFDAVFAHAVLQHVGDPLAALREMRRVLRPGGVIGVRDADHGGVLLTPASPELEQAMALWNRVWRRNGGDPELGRKHRRLLRQAGFRDVEASASYDWCSVQAETRAVAELMAYEFSASESAGTLVTLGWADEPTLARLAQAWTRWGEDPDAFFARPRCEAVGWKR